METRPYFLLGDLVSNVSFGALIGLLASSIFSESWPSLAAMALGMAGAMVLGVPITLLLGVAFGAFELMLPMMLTAMTAGMATPMLAAQGGLSLQAGTCWGAGLGAGSLLSTYLLNAALHGEVRRWTS